MKFAIIGLTSLLLLGACEHIPSSFNVCSSVAPDVVNYSKAVQDKAADEIVSGKCPTESSMLQDCEVMRDQSRVAKKGK